ncbi:MAG: aminotransferase class III-fold pyridoxal phosphate-dependent enzyme, partial [Rikenellaceae bacterium]
MNNLFIRFLGQTSPTPLAIEIERAEGIYLYSPNGKRYIDLISGVSVSNVGHSNPYIVNAVCEQAKKYMHLMVYGEMIQSPQIAIAQKIAKYLPE